MGYEGKDEHINTLFLNANCIESNHLALQGKFMIMCNVFLDFHSSTGISWLS